MLKWLSIFLIISNAYSQDFVEDVSRISHVLSEQEVENFVLEPGTKKSLDGDYLRAIAVPEYSLSGNLCEDDWTKYKPKNLRYEVIAVTKEKPKDPNLQPQTTVIVARFKEEESPIVADLKKLIANQLQSGGTSEIGKFQLKQNRDAGKTVVLYTGPGTTIDVNSTLKAEGAMNLDINPLFQNSDSRLMSPTIQMDVVNKLSVNQEIADGAGLRTTFETQHTTGTRALDSLSGTKFELRTFKAQTRFDAQLNRNVQTYTEVNFTTNTYDKEVRAIAGFDIKAANSAEILVFTGYSNRHSEFNRDPEANRIARELGFEYKSKRGVSIYSKIKDGTERRDRSIETGIKIPLGK